MRRTLQIINAIAIILLCSGALSAQSAMDSTLSDRHSGKYEVSISPNPFEDETTITINFGNKNLHAIRIFDLIGKEVFVLELKNKSGVQSFKINFSELRPGVYFCNVYGQEGVVETKKLFRTR